MVDPRDPMDVAIEDVAKRMLINASMSLGDSRTISSIKSAFGEIHVREASEMGDSGEENFDGWLPLRLAGPNKYYDYTLQELTTIRNAARILTDTNEVAKNVMLHYRNFIVGAGVQIDIYPEDLGDDPVQLANLKPDAQIRKMKENWKRFVEANGFTRKLHEYIRRKHRDGEVCMRIFNTDIPTLRFVEPQFIRTTDSEYPYGIKTAENDAATLDSIFYQPDVSEDAVAISAEEIVFSKCNVDENAPRGISSYWPTMSNFRRLEKILVNSSVLATVQAAITMIRKHEKADAAKVGRLLARTSDGVARTDPISGKQTYSRKVRPGTVLDAPKGIEYILPSHGINAGSFIDIAKHEMSHIANGFVLPIDWLLTTEPTDPLTPGSPVVANFESEQELMFMDVAEVFWKVQKANGINIEKNRTKYTLYFNGKRLAVGKALDEARVDEILLRNHAVSSQEIAAKHGYVYAISRANVIKHRKTQQIGEAMPGDAGNTNPALTQDNGRDGLSKKDGSQRSADGNGGNNK